MLVPLPYFEFEDQVPEKPRARPFFWFVALSALFHVAALVVAGIVVVRAALPLVERKQPPVFVTISSAMRIEPRAHPLSANAPLARPHAALPHPRAAVSHSRELPHPRELPRRAVVVAAVKPVVRREPRPRPHARSRELPKPVRIAYVPPKTLTPADVDAQTRMFEKTIAQARLANDPVAGAARAKVAASSTKRYHLNLQGDVGELHAEGVLYPLKRWTQDGYAYYYVRYSVEYADGSSETGEVPWPIRFPEDDDPFMQNQQRMPLPGPLAGYVLPSGTSMSPLVKNCYDHHYASCPIERETNTAS